MLPVSIEDEVIRRCTERGVTLSLAESCTGGQIGSLLVDVAGSSKVFAGGITAYHNAPKRELLNVPRELLAEHGAVSAEAVAAMAEGARAAFNTTLAIGASGSAGPGGGSADKPSGTVFIGLASPAGTVVERHLFSGSRRAYKMQVAEAGLSLVLRWLDQGGNG
jgi:PncC family amidohydrolase